MRRWRLIETREGAEMREDPNGAYALVADLPQYVSDEDRRDAARYRWMRDVGDSTWPPLKGRGSVQPMEAYIDAQIEKSSRISGGER